MTNPDLQTLPAVSLIDVQTNDFSGTVYLRGDLTPLLLGRYTKSFSRWKLLGTNGDILSQSDISKADAFRLFYLKAYPNEEVSSKAMTPAEFKMIGVAGA